MRKCLISPGATSFPYQILSVNFSPVHTLAYLSHVRPASLQSRFFLFDVGRERGQQLWCNHRPRHHSYASILSFSECFYISCFVLLAALPSDSISLTATLKLRPTPAPRLPTACQHSSRKCGCQKGMLLFVSMEWESTVYIVESNRVCEKSPDSTKRERVGERVRECVWEREWERVIECEWVGEGWACIWIPGASLLVSSGKLD